MITTFIGAIGSLILALSGLFQLFKIIKEKSAAGTSLGLLLSWVLGLFFLLIYVCFKSEISIILLINYGSGLIVSSTMLFLKFYYK